MTAIIGDKGSEGVFNGEGKLPAVATVNTDFSDTVYLEWQRSEVTLSNPREVISGLNMRALVQ